MVVKRLEKRGKRFLAAALQAVLPSRKEKPTEGDWKRVRKILLVRQDRRLGDLVMNAPLFHETRRLFPDAHITLLLRKGYERLFVEDPHIDEVVPFWPGRDLYSPVGFTRLVRGLRRRRFDLALDCSNFRSFSLTNGVITLASNAPIRIGFQDKESGAFLNVLVRCGSPRHYVENQLELLKPVTGEAAPFKTPRLYVPEDSLERGRMALRRAAEGPPRAIFFVSAGNETKRWSLEAYVEAARLVSAEGIHAVLAAGPGDARLMKYAGELPILPPMDVADFAGAVSAAELFVSGDTGPMHLAVACGAKTVTVFAEDNASRYGYEDGHRHVVLRADRAELSAKEIAAACLRLLSVSARRPVRGANLEGHVR